MPEFERQELNWLLDSPATHRQPRSWIHSKQTYPMDLNTKRNVWSPIIEPGESSENPQKSCWFWLVKIAVLMASTTISHGKLPPFFISPFPSRSLGSSWKESQWPCEVLTFKSKSSIARCSTAVSSLIQCTVIRFMASSMAFAKDLWDLQYPYVNHGAGICTPTFTQFLLPSFVGKYSSTMEHLG